MGNGEQLRMENGEAGMNRGEKNQLNSSVQLASVLAKGEGIDVEFKICTAASVPRSLYQTVCSFLNRSGGTIVLGVSDKGKVAGVEFEAIEQLKKDFVTAINNPQKLTPPAYITIKHIEYEGRHLLYTFVPESSQVHRCNGRIFDRNQDGDIDITDQTLAVAQLYQRKQAN